MSLYVEEVSTALLSADIHDNANDVVTWNDRETHFGHSLDQAQHEGLDVAFSKVPGHTQLIEHPNCAGKKRA